MARRENGTGNVYQRKDGLWVARVEAGYTRNGTRRRVTVSAKTEAQCKRKLRDLIKKLDSGAAVGPEARINLKTYAEQWLEKKRAKLSPKGYNAAASPIRKWIIPTIGHRRVSDLTATDVRALEKAQRDAGLKGSTAAATQRTLVNMLNDAVRDGLQVKPAVLKAEKPAVSTSDRQPLPMEHVTAILQEAEKSDGGLRWLLAVVYGWRQNEVLGMTTESLDLANGRVWLDWQLQALPYNVPRDRASGFRVPDEHESMHLVDAWHLVRPKTAKGRRWAPVTPELGEALRRQAEKVARHGLLFAHPDGRPINDKQDRAAWRQLQVDATAAMAEGAAREGRPTPPPVAHPSGRPWHVHECRNVAASRLREIGADDLAITSLMGHTSINTTRIYQRVTDEGQTSAIAAMAAGLPGLGRA